MSSPYDSSQVFTTNLHVPGDSNKVTFSSANVGGHQQPLFQGSRNHPKKVTAWITWYTIFSTHRLESRKRGSMTYFPFCKACEEVYIFIFYLGPIGYTCWVESYVYMYGILYLWYLHLYQCRSKKPTIHGSGNEHVNHMDPQLGSSFDRQAFFEAIEVNAVDAWTLFDSLDADGDHLVSYEEQKNYIGKIL